ncbi:molybdopterin-dependent oxidoreductase [Natranaerobius thermophilus]|uniref:Molybdopterin oxidoreductase n=1 Tax=Natranaerobius thermophilus (strain ATCC BAA-1301 / DSM 18059 / JW/NM-WN-LF) TaxID=457570 RepID=B2A6V7_NATTJ|nr:molybdopterin-dependent oxidoreductase [Natranaerobius thermophilus]ACB84238.1 molybdopterin oxidoreductase [Natranaerobius thermophilus JW/NM-WN-LF]
MTLKKLLNKEIKRRTFLAVTGAAGAGIAIGHGLAKPPEEAEAEEKEKVKEVYEMSNRIGEVDDYVEGQWIPTGCSGCTSWCSKEANVVNGRVIKVRGNKNSKVNGEVSCPRAHLSLQQLYDPDRIKQPMKRTNPDKGRDVDPDFVPISWDEAMEEIADKILELREQDENHKIAVQRGRYTQLRDIIYSHVPAILGTPNNISHSSICAEAEKFGPYYTEGYWNYRDFDVLNSEYIILWGADPIASNRQISYYLGVWPDVLDKAKVAVIEPRLSASATKAHEWLPVKPAEDGALAVAMAHVILTQGLWNKEFVGDFHDGENRFIPGKTVDEETFEENYTHGLVKWWNLELKDRTPEWAEARSGVPRSQIIRVATEFAEKAPKALVWMGGGPVMQVRGGYTSMAISALNGLVGSVDSEGGTLRGAGVPRKSYPAPDEYMDENAQEKINYQKIDQRGYLEFPALKEGKPGSGVVTNRMADGILKEDPYDIKMIMAYWNNFAFSAPEARRWEEALKKVDFIVHMVTHESEMTRYADIVLPSTHHMFEQWGFLNQKGNKHTHLWLARPMIERFFDVKDPEAEVQWLLAEKLAEKGFDKLLEHFKNFKDPETEKEPTNEIEFAEYATKLTLQPIWDPNEYESGDQFDGWEDFKAVGVWNSDEYKYKQYWDNFGTKTDKYEFYSETLKDALEKHAANHNLTVDEVLEACKYEAEGEVAFIPHYDPPFVHGQKEEYPFMFVDFKNRLNREGRSANCYWYHEFNDINPGLEKEKDVALLNPKDADEYGIKTDDKIIIKSPVGEIECYAKLWEGIPPGVVAKAYGQGHWAYGRVASENFDRGIPRGGNNNEILVADYERLSGSTAFYSHTRVRVEKS